MRRRSRKPSGARLVVVLDAISDRLAMAKRFGADVTINIAEETDEKSRVNQVKALTDGRGADIVMELVGRADVVPEGIRMLAQFGRYVGIGNINAGQSHPFDPSRLVMTNKSMLGVALYEPYTLGKALLVSSSATATGCRSTSCSAPNFRWTRSTRLSLRRTGAPCCAQASFREGNCRVSIRGGTEYLRSPREGSTDMPSKESASSPISTGHGSPR